MLGKLLLLVICAFAAGDNAVSNSSEASAPLKQDAEQHVEQAIAQYAVAMEATVRDERLLQFSRAEQLFRQAIDALLAKNEEPSADLWANLGNAALQAEHIGIAIMAYRNALAIAPNHDRANQNLAFARGLVPSWAQTQDESGLVDTLFFWTQLYSRTQIVVTAAACFLATALLLSASIATSRVLFRNLAIVPLCVWALLLLSIVLTGQSNGTQAVIRVAEETLYSADSENSSPRITDPLPDGTEVEIIQTRERWTEVRFSGRSGWLHTAALAQLRPAT